MFDLSFCCNRGKAALRNNEVRSVGELELAMMMVVVVVVVVVMIVI